MYIYELGPKMWFGSLEIHTNESYENCNFGNCEKPRKLAKSFCAKSISLQIIDYLSGPVLWVLVPNNQLKSQNHFQMTSDKQA